MNKDEPENNIDPATESGADSKDHDVPEIPAETENFEQEIEESKVEPQASSLAGNGSRLSRFKSWYGARKKWTIPLSGLLILALLFAIPFTRYSIAGLFIKNSYTISVKDSTSNTPVSGARVSADGISSVTDAEGKATLHNLKVGSTQFTVAKKYYQDSVMSSTVPILKQKNIPEVSLVATGRQVKIKVTNYIDGGTLANVSIQIAGTSAKTDKTGTATVVVPASSSSEKASLSLDGYLDANVSVAISADKIAENDYKLVPAGRVYFFSTRTGKLDLMKINIDGSDIKTVLAGTGNESVSSSSISQSPDWKYVTLILKRDSADQTPQLYILSTDDDKLLSVDSGKANFSIKGWVGDSLIYTSSRTDLPAGQPGTNKLKSYDATTGKITVLDQSGGVSDANGTATENYDLVMISGNTVVYAKSWTTTGDNRSEQTTLNAVAADGQNHKTPASYNQDTYTVFFSQNDPNSLYVWQQPKDNSPSTYFEYTVGDIEPKPASITIDQFYSARQGFYPSPSARQVLWSEPRDGKNAVLVSPTDGGNPQTVGSFSDELPYSWFGENDLVLSKNSNELYIVSAKGGTPIKITDYQNTYYYY